MSKVLTDAEFRHGLLDPHVSKRRVKLYGRGLYVNAAELESALRERDVDLQAGDLDRYVARIGGHRVERRRVLHAGALVRSYRLDPAGPSSSRIMASSS